MADIEWAVEHAHKSFEGKPIFLMGHSMVNFTITLALNFGSDVFVQGGGEVLGFATQGEKGVNRSVLSSISGVISTSPLIEQATPAFKVAKWVGSKVSNVLPYTLVPAPVNADVRQFYFHPHIF